MMSRDFFESLILFHFAWIDTKLFYKAFRENARLSNNIIKRQEAVLWISCIEKTGFMMFGFDATKMQGYEGHLLAII